MAETSETRPNHTKKFKTLSGMAQHVEAGSCKGGLDVLGAVAAFIEGRIRDATGQEVALLRRRN